MTRPDPRAPAAALGVLLLAGVAVLLGLALAVGAAYLLSAPSLLGALIGALLILAVGVLTTAVAYVHYIRPLLLADEKRMDLHTNE